MNYLLSTLLFLAVSFSVIAQNGKVRGTIIEKSSGETLPGVAVVFDGTSNGAVTDLDGKFTLSATPGLYAIRASYIGMEDIVVKNVEVKADEVTVLGTLLMSEASDELEEFVIESEAVNDSETAVLTIRREATTVLDAVSSEAISRSGDGDAAAAIKRLPGVSVEGGKYVYVRGLGDRYSKTMLNGIDIPGLDPDRNSVQMDLFPTEIIENMMVSKTFTANLPADFTGGVVNIQTKSFPEEEQFSVNLGLGFNPSMHFRSDFLDYQGSNTDFLGFDNGTREFPLSDLDLRTIPTQNNVDRTNSEKGQQYLALLDRFDRQMAPTSGNNLMNGSFGLTYGNQKDFENSNNKLGYSLSLSYSGSTRHFDDAFFGTYVLSPDRSNRQMQAQEIKSGTISEQENFVTGMGGLAFKTQLSKIVLNLLHIQNGVSKSSIFDRSVRAVGSGSSFEANQYVLDYSQRSLTNILLGGEHAFSAESPLELEWSLSPTFSNISEPDVRSTNVRVADNGNLSVGTESGLPVRIWRSLNEQSLTGRLDLKYKHTISGMESKLITGVSSTYKDRSFNILTTQMSVDREINDPNRFLDDEFLLSPTNLDGTLIRFTGNGFIGNSNPNAFDGQIFNTGVYASEEIELAVNLKAIAGVRMEYYTQYYTGTNQNNQTFTNEQVIEDLGIFPTASIIYDYSSNIKVRGAFARTTARPSFKEASFAQIFDPISGRYFIGGFSPDVSDGDTLWDGNLTTTDINNLDLRIEYFGRDMDFYAISGFYKSFQNPIEMVFLLSADNNIQPRNVGNGELFGVELEVRKNLGFLAPILSNFGFNGNLTLVKSAIEMSESEIISREQALRDGETVGTTRRMAGQAPVSVNVGVNYGNRDNGLNIGVFYNVQGQTLQYITARNYPDVYSDPFHSLNFKASYEFGAARNWKASLKASNLLGDKREYVYVSEGSTDGIFSSFDPGRLISTGISYTF